MGLVAGVDGCRAGWVVVLAETTRDARGMSTEVAVARDFDGVLALTRDARVVGVDMPIGLLDAHAVAWSAARIARDRAVCLPGRPAPRDARGLPMAIWY